MQSTLFERRRISVVMCAFLLGTLASWAGCFWLGFQLGNARFEHRRKAEIDDLEQRFKIIDGEAAGTPATESVGTRPYQD